MGDGKLEAYALYQLASLHVRVLKEEGKLAVKAIEAAVKLCQKEGQKRQQVHMLLLSAEARLTLANEIADKASYDTGAQRTLGECTSKAAQAVQDAVALAGRVQSNSLQAVAHHWNAQVLLALGDLPSAMAASDRARSFYQLSKDQVGEAHSILVTAKAFLRDQNRAKAQQLAEEAMEMFKAAGDKEGEEAGSQTVQEMAKAAIGLDDVYTWTPLSWTAVWTALQPSPSGTACSRTSGSSCPPFVLFLLLF